MVVGACSSRKIAAGTVDRWRVGGGHVASTKRGADIVEGSFIFVKGGIK